MPTLIDSVGKSGRSMDCSQIIDFKKKYRIVQQENSKTPKGNQSQKPAFNSGRLDGGGSDNGASVYYNQRGAISFFFKFFGKN